MALTQGPAPVSGYSSTPTPVGPLTSPPPQGGGIGSFVVPTAPRATTMTTSTRFIEIDYNGNIITSAVTSMDFTGPGVIVSNIGSAVTINIPGSNGTPTGPNNSLQFNSLGTLAGNSRLVFDPSTSILTVTGNVSANYFVGDATRLTNIPGANIVGTILYAEAANVATTANTVITAAQPNITSVGTLTSVTVTNNITGGNVLATGRVSATGNIAGQYVLGNGSFLSGLPATYNNSNVTGLLAAFDSNPISTTGNVTAGYFIGNGSQLTGLPAIYGNSNVATLLAGFGSNVISTTGNVTGGNLRTAGLISATGDITGGNVNAGASITATAHTGATFSATGNITGGNLRTVGQVSATGNITGSFFVGNGSLLTGIAASGYGNANVVTLLASYGSNTISTTGNVTAGNFVGNVVGGGAGTPTISSATNLDLSAVSAVRVIGGGTFRLPSLTTAQIANTIAANGDMIYNSSVNKFQGYENGAWANII